MQAGDIFRDSELPLTGASFGITLFVFGEKVNYIFKVFSEYCF